MKKVLRAVHPLGQRENIKISAKGTHFVGRVVSVEKRKEAIIESPEGGCFFKLNVPSGLHNALKEQHATQEETFLLLEEKGSSSQSILKLKDIAACPKGWQQNSEYTPTLPESVVVSMREYIPQNVIVE